MCKLIRPMDKKTKEQIDQHLGAIKALYSTIDGEDNGIMVVVGVKEENGLSLFTRVDGLSMMEMIQIQGASIGAIEKKDEEDEEEAFKDIIKQFNNGKSI